MKLIEAEVRVAAIKAITTDDERAHGMEDEFYVDVLHAIASGMSRSPARLARIALKTQELPFGRWTA